MKSITRITRFICHDLCSIAGPVSRKKIHLPTFITARKRRRFQLTLGTINGKKRTDALVKFIYTVLPRFVASRLLRPRFCWAEKGDIALTQGMWNFALNFKLFLHKTVECY